MDCLVATLLAVTEKHHYPESVSGHYWFTFTLILHFVGHRLSHAARPGKVPLPYREMMDEGTTRKRAQQQNL